MNSVNNSVNSLVYWYHFIPGENMCPLNYSNDVDTQSWGMCSCWENGGYRSKNGTLPTCRPLLPALSGENDPICSTDILCDNTNDGTEALCTQPRYTESVQYWCQQSVFSTKGQVCPTTNVKEETIDDTSIIKCADENGHAIDIVGYGVPQHLTE